MYEAEALLLHASALDSIRRYQLEGALQSAHVYRRLAAGSSAARGCCREPCGKLPRCGETLPERLTTLPLGPGERWLDATAPPDEGGCAGDGAAPDHG